MNNQLIIEIPYGGLGDHLFHSPIPRIAKEKCNFTTVLISERSLYRHPDYKKLVWEYNPYVDGFVKEKGEKIDLTSIVQKTNNQNNSNLIDEVLKSFNLEYQKKWIEPEIYYSPKFREEYHHCIFDPNFISWIGDLNKVQMTQYLKKKYPELDRIMKIRSDKALFIPDKDTKFLETPTIEDFCDLIHSSKKMLCLTSGTATIAAGLKKPCTVFYGENQERAFQHSKLHSYYLIRNSMLSRIKNKLFYEGK